MKVDLCDLKRMLRADFFAKDRDIYVQSDRHIYLGDGTALDDVIAAQYVTMAASADLANERILTGGTAISVTDGGAGGNATLDHTQVAVGDLHTEYTREAVLTAKGSIYAASAASTPAERTVGADGTVLIADSTDPTGVSWSSSPNGWIPIGGIILWSIGSGYLPANWQVCDGTNSTPDLRDKFIVGAGSSYAVGDTGGADTSDLSHTHGVGTLAADSSGAHTHGPGSLATDTEAAHTHGDGTLANNSTGSHDHTGDTGEVGSNHNHSAVTGAGGPHSHTWSDTSDGPSSTTAVQSGSGSSVASSTHAHAVSGTTSAESSHTHAIFVTGSGHTHDISSAGSHSHTISGNTASGGSHSHSVNSGVTASDGAHVHTISGSTGTGGLVAHDNRPQFYAAYFVMRIA